MFNMCCEVIQDDIRWMMFGFCGQMDKEKTCSMLVPSNFDMLRIMTYILGDMQGHPNMTHF